ncbi:cell wall hydrolase [Candidatus Gottesmanbacteria bacterium]|nr:cell wall hydrolase [Candidatus Gottesmanbacteria bacterium]
MITHFKQYVVSLYWICYIEIMLLVYEEKKKRVIKGHQDVHFSSFSAFHLVVVTARVKSRTQIASGATDDEDLSITIDDTSFPRLPDPHRIIDSPTAFSGGALHNLAKTVYFLTFLKGKEHTVALRTDTPSSTATLEALAIYAVRPEQELSLPAGNQAEDGDRRPWITITLEKFSLQSFTTTLTYSRRKRDSDDVKIVVDGKVQGNLARTIKRYLWRYLGSLLPPFATKTETETFTVDLPQGLHYLEFWADRMPSLRSLTLDFGTEPPVPEGIPTVENPTWTKDFYDDTETMLLARTIYGEVGGESYEAKIAVAWSIRNRVEDAQKRWGGNYHEVILRQNQYDALWDKRTYDKVRNPPTVNKQEQEAWKASNTAAVQVVSGRTPDPTRGANHFYASPIAAPSWADEKKFTVQIGSTMFYKL